MSTEIQSNNKRIAKNTFLLYIRMFVMMAISLYTSRVILQTLGVEDFGIYNVVGGVITMLGVIKGVMAGASARYITFGLGKNDIEYARKSLNVSLMLYVGLAVIILVVGETFGLWFLNSKLIIPENRLVAANWIYQFSIISIINTILANPYTADIIAREKMGIYAYVSIFEAIWKLVIAYAIAWTPFDRLIFYGFLIMFGELLVMMLYRISCIKNFEEAKFKLYKELSFYKEMLFFSFWNLFGSLASMVKGQGLNILINMFFNPSVNAARGISYQINTAINRFASNFYQAVSPQITKYYAQGDYDNLYKLSFRSSKMSFYLIYVISLPIVIESPYIVSLWLGQLPDYVVPFTRLIVAISAVECMQYPIFTIAQATGKIAFYQIVTSLITISILPVAYICLDFDFQPESVFYVSLINSVIALFARLWILKRLAKFPVLRYIKEVFMSSIIVSVVAAVLPIISHIILKENFVSVAANCMLAVLSACFTIYYLGFNKEERAFTIKLIQKKLKLKY